MNLVPEISTKRLLLRGLKSADIPAIVKHANNKSVSDTTLNIPYPYTEKDAIFWINMSNEVLEKGLGYIFGMELKDDKEFMGGISLSIEPPHDRGLIGYWIAEDHWNKGYTSEAVAAIIEFGFKEAKLHKIYSNHIKQNPASGRVMVKNKMVKEAELKNHVRKGNTYYTLIQYRLTREEYENL